MNNRIRLHTRFAQEFWKPEGLNSMKSKAAQAAKSLLDGKSPGNDFLGWLRLPLQDPKDLVDRIRASSDRITSQGKYLVVVGIGGSYLGARAVIEAGSTYFGTGKGVQVLFAGHHLDGQYHEELLSFLEDKDFSINVISKSGTTTEPALAFRMLLDLARRKYSGKDLQDRIICTTDREKGTLKQMATEFGWETYVIPDDVGGRYSVLTPVGLLPIQAAGLDASELLVGAKEEAECLLDESRFGENPVLEYAAIRNLLYSQGKTIEVLASYDPKMQYVSEWWKQLFGESEGKDQKGIFPASVQLTTDLHSLGQYLQDGKRQILETVLEIREAEKQVPIPSSEDERDGLSFLEGKNYQEVNSQARLATLLAHSRGGVPCLELELPDRSVTSLGALLYFFEFACGVSGNLLGVNPFDQPGVEEYKRNMFALLNKPGYEKQREEILKSLGN